MSLSKGSAACRPFAMRQKSCFCKVFRVSEHICSFVESVGIAVAGITGRRAPGVFGDGMVIR